MKTLRTTLWMVALMATLIPATTMARVQENATATMISISQTEACYNATLSNIHVALQGIPPFRVVYSDGAEQYAVDENSNDLEISVEPAVTTTYELVSVLDGNGEYGSVSGSVTLTVYNAPSIIQDLSAVPSYACAAETVYLNMECDGWNLSYRWYKDGLPIADNASALTSTLIIPSFMTADSGLYSCRVRGYCSDDELQSVEHLLMPSVQPELTEDLLQGVKQLCTGSSLFSHVTASGTEVQYQWRRNGEAIPGATQSTLSVLQASAQDVGVYDCMINSRCFPTPILSSEFTLMIDAPLGIVSQPESIVVCDGRDAEFVVSAFGSEPLYRWYKDGNEILGNPTAVTPHLVLQGITESAAGNYMVSIGTRCSEISIASADASLEVLPAPRFIELPSSTSVCTGASVLLNSRATGMDVRYQWFKDDRELEGATDSALVLFDIQPEAAGAYTVRVSDVCATIESEEADVVVFSPVRIIEQPRPTTVCVSSAAVLSVRAIGSTGLYEWFRDGIALPASNTPEYLIESAEAEHAGMYTCKLSGAVECSPGFVMTDTVRLRVVNAPAITFQTRTAYAALHGEASLRVAVEEQSIADIPLRYQWYANGIPLADNERTTGSESSFLVIRSIGVADAQQVYTCRIHGMCGVVLSDVIRIVIPPITIMQEPADAKICLGSSAQVGIVAVTDEGIPLTYQWLRNGLVIPGATDSWYSMPIFTDANNGEYSVRLHLGDNVFVSSRSARLVAVHTPRFADLDEFHSMQLCPGTYFSLRADLADGNDLGYQWFVNGQPIAGAAESSYLEYAITNQSAGLYSVRVFNDCGTIEHAVAQLTVLPETEITSQPVSELIVREASLLQLSVQASGHRVQYQWEHNGVEIPGAINAVFSKIAIPEDAGSYRARVMSTCGVVYSTPALVMVNSISGADDPDEATVVAWSIGPCAPHPVFDRCVIPLTVAKSTMVRVSVVDVFGREACVISDAIMSAGVHQIVLDAAEYGLPSGRYTVVLSAGTGARVSTPMMIAR
ncbi:MAG: hypothetical protein RL156_1792, partial [Bacteroidota bacterium]